MILLAVAGMFSFAACNNNATEEPAMDSIVAEETVAEEVAADSTIAVEGVAEEAITEAVAE